MTQTATIDEIIERLGLVVEECRHGESRIGYFAALYRRVTVAVMEGIAFGRFEDGPRMERFDVIFANRFIDAYERFRQGQHPGDSWRLAFESASVRRLLAVQHLLLGMNAHINLDLGIAAAHTSPGNQLLALRGDFDEINKVLAELVDDVQGRISGFSPWLGLIDHIGNTHDEAIVNFSLINARNAAWAFASRLAPLGQEDQAREIARQDLRFSIFGRAVRTPGKLGSLIALAIRLRESSDVREIIDALS